MQVLEGGNKPGSGIWYTCNVCGMESVWTKDHMHIERWARKSDAIDYRFIICSDACLANAKPVFVKWLTKLPGWTKKLAEENVQYAFVLDEIEEIENTIDPITDNSMIKVKKQKKAVYNLLNNDDDLA